MKTLINRKIIVLIVAIGVAVISYLMLSNVENKVSVKLDEKNGFRNFKLGENITDNKFTNEPYTVILPEICTYPAKKIYIYEQEALFGIDLEKVQCYFDTNGKLVNIVLDLNVTNSKSAEEKMKDFEFVIENLRETFDDETSKEVVKDDGEITKYTWEGNKVVMVAKFKKDLLGFVTTNISISQNLKGNHKGGF